MDCLRQDLFMTKLLPRRVTQRCRSTSELCSSASVASGPCLDQGESDVGQREGTIISQLKGGEGCI